MHCIIANHPPSSSSGCSMYHPWAFHSKLKWHFFNNSYPGSYHHPPSLSIGLIVETSHEATNSSSLVASSPSGYNFLDKARRLPPRQDAPNLRGRIGGGIYIFYRNYFRACSKDTGDYTTFEPLTTYFTFKDLHLLIVVIYRPGSMPITTLFFEEFSSLLATLSNYTPVLPASNPGRH